MTDIRELAGRKDVQLGAGALGAVGVAVAIVAVAFVGWGVWSAIGAAVGLGLGAIGPWAYVRVMFAPIAKGLISTAFFILAQLTFGAGALVRRDDGGYEWRRLREDEEGLYTVLSTGDRVPIEGRKADLPTVAWAPLAVVEQKTGRNMDQWTVDETFREVRPDPRTDGEEMVETPLALADGGEPGWHLDASKLARWARGSGGNELPRNGRRKALEEEGGEQQISQLVTMVGAGALMVLGFVLGAGAMML